MLDQDYLSGLTEEQQRSLITDVSTRHKRKLERQIGFRSKADLDFVRGIKEEHRTTIYIIWGLTLILWGIFFLAYLKWADHSFDSKFLYIVFGTILLFAFWILWDDSPESDLTKKNILYAKAIAYLTGKRKIDEEVIQKLVALYQHQTINPDIWNNSWPANRELRTRIKMVEKIADEANERTKAN